MSSLSLDDTTFGLLLTVKVVPCLVVGESVSHTTDRVTATIQLKGHQGKDKSMTYDMRVDSESLTLGMNALLKTIMKGAPV